MACRVIYQTHIIYCYLLNCNLILLFRHLGENSRLVVVKNAGHAANLEKSKEVCKSIIDYFQETASSASIRVRVGNGCDASNLLRIKRLSQKQLYCNTLGVYHQLSNGFELKHDMSSGNEGVKIKST